MSDPKPDIMDGCGVSFWVIASLALLLAIPLGIRTCSDSGNDSEVDELERMQRIRKIQESTAEQRAFGQNLTISLNEAMNRTLKKHGVDSLDESNTTGDKDDNATRDVQP